LAAILGQIVTLLREEPREHTQAEAEEAAGTPAEAEGAESSLEGITTAQQAVKGLTIMCLPTTTDVLAAQQHDAVTQSYRTQLIGLRATGGKAKLRAQGIDEKRICELSQYTLDENQVLRYSPALGAHYYNSEGLPCDANGALIAPTTVTEDRERAMIVVPKVLQHAVMYLHHYPRLAAHPGWADIYAQTHPTRGLHMEWSANIMQANVQAVQGMLQCPQSPHSNLGYRGGVLFCLYLARYSGGSALF
jgi:hypothetical protein